MTTTKTTASNSGGGGGGGDGGGSSGSDGSGRWLHFEGTTDGWTVIIPLQIILIIIYLHPRSSA